MEQKPADSALMLVGVLPAKKDYEIARLLGWYRIPLRMAPKVVDVEYLAFYQTGAFGSAERWQINWFAPVKGYELTTRRQLIRDEPDHPRADEEYYKMSLGPLQKREKPITADKWKRLTFLYTTGQLFNEAEIINDLVVRSEERQILWRNLRDRAVRSNKYTQAIEEPVFLSDPSMFEFFGNLLINSDQEDDDLLEF